MKEKTPSKASRGTPARYEEFKFERSLVLPKAGLDATMTDVCRSKKDSNLLTGILKRRLAREEQDKQAKAKLEEARQRASEREANSDVEQHILSLEQQINDSFRGDCNEESTESFLESVQVIRGVEQLDDLDIQLGETLFGRKMKEILGCMSASLGYTEKQRTLMIVGEFMLSGMMEALVQTQGVCPKELLCLMVRIIGHHDDIEEAGNAKRCLERIWKLLYIGKKKPASLPNAVTRVHVADLPSFGDYYKELVANGCQMKAVEVKEDVRSQGYPESSRIHFIGLILDAISDYCCFLKDARCHLDQSEIEQASILVQLVICLRYDPNAFRILESLDTALVCLLGAFDDVTWKMLLPTLSYQMAVAFSMDAPKGLKVRVIRGLPCGFRILNKRMDPIRRRCTELQQLAAALMLDVILEPLDSRKQPRKSITTRYPLDVESFISSQNWFSNMELLSECPSSESNAMNHFTRVEMLLHLSNLMMWPYILTAMNSSTAPITYLTTTFLKKWANMLAQLQRRIKNLNPEEQAVKVLANFWKMQYETYLDEYCNIKNIHV